MLNLICDVLFQMDLNFTFSPSPNKRLRTNFTSESPAKDVSPDKMKTAARDLLSGALKEAIKKEDDEEICSEIDSLSSPMKRLIGSGISPYPSPSKSARKRKRKEQDKTPGYHHTFVMKLFDRSVDLAQFRDVSRSTYPLYPVARAWIRNQPSNLSQAPHVRSPTPDPDSDDNETDETDHVYKLPLPDPLPDTCHTTRVPPPPTRVMTTSELDLDLDQSDGLPGNVLLSNHLVRWWSVRKSWKQAAADNEKRYQKSLNVLKEMFEK